MTFRSGIALLLLTCASVQTDRAAALDCQSADTPLRKAICADPSLEAAETERMALHQRLANDMSPEERALFEARQPAQFGAVPALCAAYDKACILGGLDSAIAELQMIDGKRDGSEGRLHFHSRARGDNDPDLRNPKINVRADYVLFDRPRTAAERLFNKEVLKLVERLDFDSPIPATLVEKWQDTIAVGTIYRSPRLISATFSTWACCGAHGAGGSVAVNVDAQSGYLFSPEGWFHLDEVAAACWYQFRELEKGGDAFRRQVPLGGAIAGFSQELAQPAMWLVSRGGVQLPFGNLMGYATGPYTCTLDYKELAKAANYGAVLPP